jgi:MFS transporter, PPP family, 3-phenylpropionic acid transporter
LLSVIVNNKIMRNLRDEWYKRLKMEAPMAAYFFLFAAGMSAYVAFVTMWQHSIGYSKMLIGALSAASAFTAVVLQPALSLLADRSRTKNAVLRLMLLIQAAAAFLHMLPGPWAYVLLVMSVLTTFQSAALGLSNAVILDHLKGSGEEERFGGIRLSYSWGYAASGLAAGFLASRNTNLVFALCGGVNLLALAASALLPGVPGFQKENRKRMGFRALFKFREFWVFIAYSLMVHTTHSLAIAFLPVYFSSLGAPNWAYGIGVFIMAAAETPFLLTSGRLIKRFGIRKLLIIPGLAFALRWFLTSVVSSWGLLLLIYGLQGFGIIIIYVGLARYVCDYLPPELSATGQGAVNSVVVSVSRIIGALLGGVLATCIGMRATFSVMGFISLAAVAGLGIYTFSQKNMAIGKK